VNSRIRTCFISAVAGTPLGALRDVLAGKGVQVVVPEELSPGSDWSSELASIISRVDLVIGVLTRDRRSSWVLFELGQAIALKRQVVVFAPPQIKGLPFDQQRFPVVRVSLRNREALSFALDQVLASPAPTARVRESRPAERRSLGPNTDHLLRELRSATETRDWRRVESVTAEALRLAGVDVISEAAVANRRVDFAIWSDALQPVMGNPLLVEVKGELRGTDALRKAAQQLSAVTSAAGTGWGLLLYGDALIADERLLLSVPPNVLVLSLSSLFEEMRGRPFAEIVKDLRNRRVHGVGRL
jgi:hypothetical protein